MAKRIYGLGVEGERCRGKLHWGWMDGWSGIGLECKWVDLRAGEKNSA